MKFKLDENLPVELKTHLITSGHDSETVADEGLSGAADPRVVAACLGERRVLLTMDKGIADVRAYPPEKYAGIILFRPATQGRKATLDFILRHLPALSASEIDGHLLVVSESGIRIR